MTDGPFKNAALSGRWQKFGNALDNDAMSRDERTEHAEYALSKDLSKDFRALVQDLDRFAKGVLRDAMPRLAIEDIFDRHPMSPLADTLKRFLSANFARSMSIETALSLALDNTIRREQHNIRNRMVEESMYARDRKDLATDRYSTVVNRLGEAIDGIDISKMCKDVLTNKTTPRAALTKKTGIDDGPSI